jgi:hypothetical protein
VENVVAKRQRDVDIEVNVDKIVEALNEKMNQKLSLLENLFNRISDKGFLEAINTSEVSAGWNTIVRYYQTAGISRTTQEMVKVKVQDLNNNVDAMVFGLAKLIGQFSRFKNTSIIDVSKANAVYLSIQEQLRLNQFRLIDAVEVDSQFRSAVARLSPETRAYAESIIRNANVARKYDFSPDLSRRDDIADERGYRAGDSFVSSSSSFMLPFEKRLREEAERKKEEEARKITEMKEAEIADEDGDGAEDGAVDLDWKEETRIVDDLKKEKSSTASSSLETPEEPVLRSGRLSIEAEDLKNEFLSTSLASLVEKYKDKPVEEIARMAKSLGLDPNYPPSSIRGVKGKNRADTIGNIKGKIEERERGYETSSRSPSSRPPPMDRKSVSSGSGRFGGLGMKNSDSDSSSSDSDCECDSDCDCGCKCDCHCRDGDYNHLGYDDRDNDPYTKFKMSKK